MNEKMNKALAYFGRKDLTDGLYENDIDDNVQVFLTIRQMIKLYNLQSKIDKANEILDKLCIYGYKQAKCRPIKNTTKQEVYNAIYEIKEILGEDK